MDYSDHGLKVVVLLAAYNGTDFIDEQIKSILSQKISLDLFISIDLSNDDTYSVCEKYAESNENIFVLPYGEKFGDAATNFFRLIKDVDIENYDYVAFSDQDDIWFEDKISHACSVMQSEGYKGMSSDVIAFWEDGKKSLIKKSQPQRKYDYLFESAGPGCSFVVSVKQLSEFKTLLIEKKQLLRQIALHDWLIYAFFRSRSYTWYIDNRPKMFYRQHRANQVGANNGLKAAIKRLTLVKRSWYRGQVYRIAEFINEASENKIYESSWLMIKNIGHTRRRLKDRISLLVFVLFGIF